MDFSFNLQRFAEQTITATAVAVDKNNCEVISYGY